MIRQLGENVAATGAIKRQPAAPRSLRSREVKEVGWLGEEQRVVVEVFWGIKVKWVGNVMILARKLWYRKVSKQLEAPITRKPRPTHYLNTREITNRQTHSGSALLQAANASPWSTYLPRYIPIPGGSIRCLKARNRGSVAVLLPQHVKYERYPVPPVCT